MFQTLYLSIIVLFFLVAFIIRNIKTHFSTGLSIKAKSPIVNLSILFSGLLYIAILLRLSFLDSIAFLEFSSIKNQIFDYLGYFSVTLGFIIGLLSLNEMKNSWRVGIKYEQKTKLVTTGIYKYSRNPYFLSYILLMFGFILIFPSVFLIVPYIGMFLLMHKMILEEEKYLEKVHGTKYLDYKNKVKRYFLIV